MMSDESINFSSRNEGEERWEETAEHCRGSKHILEIYRLTLVSRPSPTTRQAEPPSEMFL